jgi:hypothetical protein
MSALSGHFESVEGLKPQKSEGLCVLRPIEIVMHGLLRTTAIGVFLAGSAYGRQLPVSLTQYCRQIN